jgi:serine/threonine protein kinase
MFTMSSFNDIRKSLSRNLSSLPIIYKASAFAASIIICWITYDFTIHDRKKLNNEVVHAAAQSHQERENTTIRSQISPPIIPQFHYTYCDREIKFEGNNNNEADEGGDEDSMLEAHYDLTKKELGEGAYATVYMATDKKTGENVAVKSISRAYTNREAFQREMRAMQYILQFGGHPNIVSLHTYFEDDDHFHVVMDYIAGSELFDHLIKNGAYSEADAARLVRDVASALAFLHGIGVVHADLKPENLLLSSENASDAMVKLVDFGSTHIPGADNQNISFTPAYAPPEVLSFRNETSVGPLQPSMDMWALGIILYIMLVGLHPFALTNTLSDEELEARIISFTSPPIRDSHLTAHLSESAKELLERLIEKDPRKRMNAQEMLAHPWVSGKTAATDTISGSAERLRRIRAIKTRIQANFLNDVVTWSDNENHTRRQISLIDESFKTMFAKNGGYLPLFTQGNENQDSKDHTDAISMTEFRSLLAENMKHKFFPRNHIVYNEGEVGNHMYVIVSGTIEVTTFNGSRAERTQGDFFGEGALLHPKGIRSGTIRCKTPVHVIEISREYFQKYLQSSELGLMLAVKEKDRIRKRNRAKMILSMQPNQIQVYKKGEILYRKGDAADNLFIVDGGDVKITAKGKHVFTASKGNICGEQSVITGLNRNSTAECVTDSCTVQVMTGREFRRLMDLYPDAKQSLRELCLRRDLKKAIVYRLNKEFPYDNPREAFLAVGVNENGELGMDSIRNIMRDMDPDYTNEEIKELVQIMDLTNSGTISYEEFCKVFIADLRTSASI